MLFRLHLTISCYWIWALFFRIIHFMKIIDGLDFEKKSKTFKAGILFLKNRIKWEKN